MKSNGFTALSTIEKDKIEYDKDVCYTTFRQVVLSKSFECIYKKQKTFFYYEDFFSRNGDVKHYKNDVKNKNNKDKNNNNEPKKIKLSKSDFTQLLIDLFYDFIVEFVQNTRLRKSSVKYLNFRKLKICIIVLIAIITALCCFFKTFSFVFGSAIIIYFSVCCIFKNLILFYCFFTGKMSIKNRISKNKTEDINIKTLPKYTILVPMFKENEITIINLIASLYKLHYPKHLLDVKFVLEADDAKMRTMLKNEITLPEWITPIWVPYFEPRTKPKACNVASLFADCNDNDVVVIFDAEDKPDENQLLMAVNEFKQNENIKILQGCLSFYNYDQNLLTQLFNIEYSVWFKIILKCFYKLGVTIPLGGTSNHIKFSFLEQCNFWDAYNVTEDLELSTTTAFEQIGHLGADTKEWCVVDLKAWLKQRTRWMKGYFLTYIIGFCNRKKVYNFSNFSLHFFFIFGSYWLKKIMYHFFTSLCFHQIIIGYSTLMYLLLPFVSMFLWQNYSATMFATWGVCNVIYYSSYIIIYVYLIQTKFVNFSKATLIALILYPLYFVLHFIACWKAFFEVFTKPFYWSKTAHNATLHTDL